jgi:hypothetical protein
MLRIPEAEMSTWFWILFHPRKTLRAKELLKQFALAESSRLASGRSANVESWTKAVQEVEKMFGGF